MKLVTFTDNAGTRIGIAKDDGIVDLKKADADLPRDMITLMSEWPTHRATVERAATRKAAPIVRSAPPGKERVYECYRPPLCPRWKYLKNGLSGEITIVVLLPVIDCS